MSEKLPADLVWDRGHLGEVARTAIADGQEAIVPEEALVHLQTCVECMHAVGDAALVSARVQEALGAPSAKQAVAGHAEETIASVAPISSSARRPLPVFAVAAAMVLAIVGMVPSLGELPTSVSQMVLLVTYALPHVVRAAVAVLRGPGLGPSVSVATAAMLVAMGFAVARSGTRRTRAA